jgi:adenosylmethionine-8-amino-7-oxononanoate aminotransferase
MLSPVLKNDLAAQAIDHCIFPIIDAAEVKRDGPAIVASGTGLTIIDGAGKPHLDMISAYTRANSLGYGNQEIARAMYDQMIKMHYAGTVSIVTEPMVQLARSLAELAPGELSRAFFVSGGSEAVESAVKIAKQYQVGSGKKPHAYKIISRWNAYHGATAGAMALTNHLSVANTPDPAMPGVSKIPNPSCYRNPFGMSEDEYFEFCANYLEQQILHEGPELVAAFIGEPIMQANGTQIPSKAYWQRVREICSKYGVLLIVDEVICCFGRTGAWFATEHFGIEPDIMTMAKALTAGYAPMGAVMTTEAIADAIPHFRHVHTFSGHAGCAAAANAVIAIKKREGLIDKAYNNGVYFLAALKDKLSDLPGVGDIRGLGHWHAVDFTSNKKTKALPDPKMVKAIADTMKSLGVLVGAAGTAIEVAPGLIATREDFDRTVDAFKAAITAIAKDYEIAAA